MKPLQEERLLSTALLLLATVELDSVINALIPWITLRKGYLIYSTKQLRVKGLDQKLGRGGKLKTLEISGPVSEMQSCHCPMLWTS